MVEKGGILVVGSYIFKKPVENEGLIKRINEMMRDEF